LNRFPQISLIFAVLSVPVALTRRGPTGNVAPYRHTYWRLWVTVWAVHSLDLQAVKRK